MEYADIHCHLLPAVDDGSRSLEETLSALRRFRDAGVSELAFTPHLAPSWGSDDMPRRMTELREAFERVREHAADEPGLPALRLGQEVFAWDAPGLRPLLEHPELGYAGSRFLLLEFGFDLSGRPEAAIEEAIRLARATGREVLLAHPERYRHAAGIDPLDAIRRWRDLGAFLQVNLGSLTGYYDRTGTIRRLGWDLLEHGLAHLLSSDDHGENRPQTYHGEIHRELLERGAAAQAKLLLEENARRVLRGELPLEVAPLPGVVAGAAA